MSIKPVGGRGKKAPYDTVVVRVPKPILTDVEALIEDFRLNNNSIKSKIVDKNLAIDKAKKILKLKKSSKYSLLKLLQVLYDNTITEKDLENL